MLTPDFIKDHVVRTVASFRCGDGGVSYNGRAGEPASLAASCDAALCLYGIDRQDGCRLGEWGEYLQGFQDPATGWFDDDKSCWVEQSRQAPWLFGLGLRALNAVNAQPRHPLNFLQAWSTPEGLCSWVHAGKGVMHMAILWFAFGKHAHPFPGFEDAFFEALEETESHFQPERPAFRAALAGRAPSSARLILKDAFHNLFAWYASGRAIPEPELYVDWFLNEQDDDGFFFQSRTSTVYSHMDGLQMVVEFMRRFDYRRDECREAIRRGLDAILAEKHFEVFWQVEWIHLLLASCETVAQAVTALPDHPFARTGWHRVWSLDMWRVEPDLFPAPPET